MKEKGKGLLRPLLFTVGGALAGLVIYLLVGCPSGACAITSSPVNSMLYMGFVGFVLSGGLCGGRCCGGSCGIGDDREA